MYILRRCLKHHFPTPFVVSVSWPGLMKCCSTEGNTATERVVCGVFLVIESQDEESIENGVVKKEHVSCAKVKQGRTYK